MAVDGLPDFSRMSVLFVCVRCRSSSQHRLRRSFPCTCSESCKARRISLCCGGEANTYARSPQWDWSARETEQQQHAGAFSILSAKCTSSVASTSHSATAMPLHSWAGSSELGTFRMPEALSATFQACSFISAKGFVARILCKGNILLPRWWCN